MIAARQIFLGRGGKSLPYDAEVEYLESTGTQYIDTGVIPNETIGADMDFMVSKTSSKDKIILMAGGDSVSWRWGFSSVGDNLQVSGINAPGVTWQNFTMPRGIRHEVKFNYDNDYRCYLDGELIREDIPHGTTARNETIWINASYNGGVSSPWRANSMKIYSLKMVDAVVLIRDYIPVRFTNELGQSEGAMYDRVSGQLFRNQGTGAFLYGGDVYSVPVETSQYVQDGLVAMWDGKENAGVGKHSTAVGAVNLAGGAELVFPSNLAKWSMGERSFDLSLVYHTDTNGRITIPISTFNLSQFSTEICLLRGSDSTGEFGLVQDGVSYLTELSGASTALFRAYNSGGGIVINAQPNIGDTTAPRTLTFTYDGTTARFYADGELKTSAAMELRAAFNAGLVRIGSAYLYNSGSIFDIRIYNKALTAEQVSANAAIDQSRFNEQ